MTTVHPASDATTIHFFTPRLDVRPFAPADAEAFAGYRADPDVARYQSWSDYTVAEGRALIESMHDVRPGTPGHWYQFALEHRESGTLVGDLALKASDAEPSEAEIGFTLSPAHQGNGYGTEAVRGLLAYAFGTLELRRVIAITDALNEPAAALLGRVGMRREAHFLENVFFKGAWGSEYLFGFLHHEWSADTLTAPPQDSTSSSPESDDIKGPFMTTGHNSHTVAAEGEGHR
jgi:RimJ/RimL family protein N-acetyltransferase